MGILTPPFYVVSDTHWYHRNIIKYCNRPKEHDALMLKRWNAAVGEDDVVLHLGDLFMAKRVNFEKFYGSIAGRLNGVKYLLLGNHDEPTYPYEGLGFTVIKPFTMKYRNWLVQFDHYPMANLDTSRLRVHGHIHNNGYGGNPRAFERNINVSVEVIDYTPQSVTKLLDDRIDALDKAA